MFPIPIYESKVFTFCTNQPWWEVGALFVEWSEFEHNYAYDRTVHTHQCHWKNLQIPLVWKIWKKEETLSPRDSRNVFISLKGIEENSVRKTKQNKQQQQQKTLLFGLCFLFVLGFFLHFEFLLLDGRKFKFSYSTLNFNRNLNKTWQLFDWVSIISIIYTTWSKINFPKCLD